MATSLRRLRDTGDRAAAEEKIALTNEAKHLGMIKKPGTRSTKIASLPGSFARGCVRRIHAARALGVKKHDLDNPLVEPDHRFGNERHPDWQQRAFRLSSAIRFRHALSGEEKRTLRQMRRAKTRSDAGRANERLKRTPHVELPTYRHRNRGGLWLVDGKPLFLPGASLSDVVGLVKSIDEINNPPAAEPAKPAPVVENTFPSLSPSFFLGRVL